MTPRFLLDTHVVVRWLVQPKKLTREQARVIDGAVNRREPLGISSLSLLEIAASSPTEYTEFERPWMN